MGNINCNFFFFFKDCKTTYSNPQDWDICCFNADIKRGKKTANKKLYKKTNDNDTLIILLTFCYIKQLQKIKLTV